MRIPCICRLALLSFSTLLFAPVRLHAQGTAIEPGRVYEGGTTLHARAAGVRVTVPAGYQAGWEEGIAALAVAASDAGAGAFVWGLSSATREEMLGLIDALLRSLGISATPRAEPTQAGAWTRSEYDASSDAGAGTLFAGLAAHDAGNAAAFLVMALGDETAGRRLADQLAGAIALTAPSPRGDAGIPPGTGLQRSGDDAMYSPGGGGAGSYASRTTAQLALCHDGRYGFSSETRSIASVDGAGSIDSTSSDEHQGAWITAYDLAGRPILVLRADDDRMFAWVVERTAAGWVIDGAPYGSVAAGC